MKTKSCWKCSQSLLETQISFRTSCDQCFSDQHVCVNCDYYSPGQPNDCSMPNTEFVKDRQQRNFCSEFKHKHPTKHSNQSCYNEKFKKLFGTEIT